MHSSFLMIYFAVAANFLLFSGEAIAGYSYERIVTDFRSIQKGVEIDNSYIQPNYGYGFQYASVPGCPKAISGRPWLYYGSPTRCYLAGIQGPCSSHQTLQWRRGSSFGVCQYRRM